MDTVQIEAELLDLARVYRELKQKVDQLEDIVLTREQMFDEMTDLKVNYERINVKYKQGEE